MRLYIHHNATLQLWLQYIFVSFKINFHITEAPTIR